jgi:hypothetical protein
MKKRIKIVPTIFLFFMAVAFLLPQGIGAVEKIKLKFNAYSIVKTICKTEIQKLKPFLQELKYKKIFESIDHKPQTLIINQKQAQEIISKICVAAVKKIMPGQQVLYALSFNWEEGVVYVNVVQRERDVCIQSDEGKCGISDSQGNYIIEVMNTGSRSFTYNKCGFQTRTIQQTINPGGNTLDVTLQTANHAREICGTIHWNKSQEPRCVEVSLYTMGGCAPAFYRSIKTCAQSGSTDGYYSFGEVADPGTYMVEVSDTSCTWTIANSSCDNDNLAIINPTGLAHHCDFNGT